MMFDLKYGNSLTLIKVNINEIVFVEIFGNAISIHYRILKEDIRI